MMSSVIRIMTYFKSSTNLLSEEHDLYVSMIVGTRFSCTVNQGIDIHVDHLLDQIFNRYYCDMGEWTEGQDHAA